MHEVDMTKALIQTLQQWLDDQPQSMDITQIHLTIGEFSGVEPASLEFAFETYKQGTFLQNAELCISSIPLVAFCHRCQSSYMPEVGYRYACPICNSPMEDIISGRELKIAQIECRELVCL